MGESRLSGGIVRTDLRPWAILFLIIAAIAATLGFFLIVGVVAVVAKILFVVFAVLFLIFMIRHYSRSHSRKP
jgi:uncharacterized membrane protein YtjA (UPF0391 family)